MSHWIVGRFDTCKEFFYNNYKDKVVKAPKKYTFKTLFSQIHSSGMHVKIKFEKNSKKQMDEANKSISNFIFKILKIKFKN